jgi:mannosyltransferase
MMLQSVDAVHGLYYIFIHFWGSLFGFSDVSLRFPSAIAVGLACYGTVRIGTRVGSRFVGLAAGVVLAVLPRMVWAGSEARQYAITAAIVVALVLVTERAWLYGRRADWIAFIFLAVIGIHLFMFLALAVASLAAAAIVANRRPLAATVSSLLAAIISLPFVSFVMTQKAQVNWIPKQSIFEHLQTFALQQFFYINALDRPATGYHQPIVIVVCVSLLGILLTSVACVGIIHGIRQQRYRTLLAIVLSLLIVPICCLLITGALIQPVYVLRYLTFIAPAFALLVAIGAEFLQSRYPQLVPVMMVTVLAVSVAPQLTIKTLVKDASSISDVLEKDLQPSDSIFYDSSWAKLAHPVALEGVRDLSVDVSPEESGSLWGTLKPMAAVDFAHRGRVWVMASQGALDLSPLLSTGCLQHQSVSSDGLTLIKFDCP